MLKRQRPASPPPAMPVVPLLPPDDFHAPKRQRIQPPSLDGPSRGWNTPSRSIHEDSDEEYIDDSHDDTMVARHVQGGPQTGAYKKVNSLLHDLHAEHQYRRVLSSPSGSLPFVHRNSSFPSPAHPPSHKYPPRPTPDTPFPSGRRSSPRTMQPLPHPPGDLLGTALDEGQCVQERYEDTNKLLRFVFLQRRQELERTMPPFSGW